MTWSFTQNSAPATWAVAIYEFKEQLKTAGWVVKSSSDGTTYNSTGDQITSGASGANGFDNASAWFRIQDPAALREFTFQRNSSTGANTSRNMRLKYSKSAKFTGGSPGATQTPSATDEQVMLGAGSDASPTFTQWQSSADGTYWLNVGADNAAPYGLYMFQVVTGSAYLTKGGAFVLDPIATGGGTPTADPDPVVLVITKNGDTGTNSGLGFYNDEGNTSNLLSSIYNPICYCYHGASWGTVAAAQFVVHNNTSLSIYVGGNLTHQAYDPNDTTKDVSLPLIYLRPTSASAPYGFKGMGTVMRSFLYQASARAQLSLATINSAGDYVAVGPTGLASSAEILFPWDNAAISG